MNVDIPIANNLDFWLSEVGLRWTNTKRTIMILSLGNIGTRFLISPSCLHCITFQDTIRRLKSICSLNCITAFDATKVQNPGLSAVMPNQIHHNLRAKVWQDQLWPVSKTAWEDRKVYLWAIKPQNWSEYQRIEGTYWKSSADVKKETAAYAPNAVLRLHLPHVIGVPLLHFVREETAFGLLIHNCI